MRIWVYSLCQQQLSDTGAMKSKFKQRGKKELRLEESCQSIKQTYLKTRLSITFNIYIIKHWLWNPSPKYSRSKIKNSEELVRTSWFLFLFLLMDPKVTLQVLLSPCTSYLYSLTGPGQWAGTRHTILTQWEGVIQPFRTRLVPETETRPSLRWSNIVIFSLPLLLPSSHILWIWKYFNVQPTWLDCLNLV